MVTVEQAKQILRAMQTHKHHADNISHEMDALRDSLMVGGIDYSRDRVQTSRTGDRMAEVFARLDDLELRLLTAMKRNIDYMFWVMEIFERLDPEDSWLLNLRYVQGVPFEKLPEACESVMTYSDRHIWRLLSGAVRHFAEAVTDEDVIRLSGAEAL